MNGWRIPSPHEALAALVVIAAGLEQGEFFAPGSHAAKVVSLIMLVAAMTGIASARNYLPGRVRTKLEAFEALEGKLTPAPAEEVKP
jgi:hypothetical protein